MPRSEAGSWEVRNLQHWTRIGTMNRERGALLRPDVETATRGAMLRAPTDRFMESGLQNMPQEQSHDGENHHDSRRGDFFGLGETHHEKEQQYDLKNIRHINRREVQSADDQRNGEYHRHDQGHFAFGFEETHQAAHQQQGNVNPQNEVWCHRRLAAGAWVNFREYPRRE